MVKKNTTPFQKKTPLEKFHTKLNRIFSDPAVTQSGGSIKVRGRVLFKYSKNEVTYTKLRYYPTKKEDIIDDDFSVVIPLTDENLSLFGTNLLNPPKGAKRILYLMRKLCDTKVDKLILGADRSRLDLNAISIDKNLYLVLNQIYKEESVDKEIRFKNRAVPLISSKYNLEIKQLEFERDYSLLLEEIIASGKFTQQDIEALSSQLNPGEVNKIVIEQQVNKQVAWLIDVIEEILEVENLTKTVAQELGTQHFSFPKASISGPEHLMEKILTEYGKSSLFGVPVLLNTNKYVTHKKGLSRCQFDIILVNHLSDIELVELKRPDSLVLEFDTSRRKFYPSKDLAIAITQAERYISAVNKDNDEDYLINGKKIRDFLQAEIGQTMTVDICRPTAIIIIGKFKSLFQEFDSQKLKGKISTSDYERNGWQAYKELKAAFKNIQLLTYSELLETARTRLELGKSEK